MREEHLKLLPELHGDIVLLGLSDASGDLAGVFCSSRVIDLASAFGQHFVLAGQAWQVSFRARYLALPCPVGPQFGSE